MSLYDELKEEIKSLLLDYPVDNYIPENDTFQVIDEIESVEKRDFSKELPSGEPFLNTRKIGSSNIMIAWEVIFNYCSSLVKLFKFTVTEKELCETTSEVLDHIISDLQEERIVRASPELMRKTFKILENDREKARTKEN